MVRSNRLRRPSRHPRQKPFLDFCSQCIVHSLGVHERAPLALVLNCSRVHQFASPTAPAAKAFFVAVIADLSSSRGRSPMIGVINQPSPTGISRVNETASHSISSPSPIFLCSTPSTWEKLQYELRRHRKPSSSPSGRRRSFAVPGSSTCQKCMPREMLKPRSFPVSLASTLYSASSTMLTTTCFLNRMASVVLSPSF